MGSDDDNPIPCEHDDPRNVAGEECADCGEMLPLDWQ